MVRLGYAVQSHEPGLEGAPVQSAVARVLSRRSVVHEQELVVGADLPVVVGLVLGLVEVGGLQRRREAVRVGRSALVAELGEVDGQPRSPHPVPAEDRPQRAREAAEVGEADVVAVG